MGRREQNVEITFIGSSQSCYVVLVMLCCVGHVMLCWSCWSAHQLSYRHDAVTLEAGSGETRCPMTMQPLHVFPSSFAITETTTRITYYIKIIHYSLTKWHHVADTIPQCSLFGDGGWWCISALVITYCPFNDVRKWSGSLEKQAEAHPACGLLTSGWLITNSSI